MHSFGKNCIETNVNVNPTSINVCIPNLSNIGFDNMVSSRCSSSSCSGNSSNSGNSGNNIRYDMQGNMVCTSTSTPMSTPLVSNTGQRWSLNILNKLNNSNCNSNLDSNNNCSSWNINTSNTSSNGLITHYNTFYQDITKVNNMNSNMTNNDGNINYYYKNDCNNLDNLNNLCNVQQVYDYLIKQEMQRQMQQQIEQEMKQERALIGEWCIFIPSGASCGSQSVNTNNTNLCINNSVNTNCQTTYSNKYLNSIGSCQPTAVDMIEADACAYLQLDQIAAQKNNINVLHSNPIWNWQQLGSQRQEERQEQQIEMTQIKDWYNNVDKLLIYIKQLRTHQDIIINYFNLNKSSQYFSEYTRKVKQRYDDYIDCIIELYGIFVKCGDDGGNFKQT